MLLGFDTFLLLHEFIINRMFEGDHTSRALPAGIGPTTQLIMVNAL
jgi:hypothetical protein